jgi:hypothetical protein
VLVFGAISAFCYGFGWMLKIILLSDYEIALFLIAFNTPYFLFVLTRALIKSLDPFSERI